MQDSEWLTDLTQHDAGGRVDMGHARDVWPRGVDPRVDPELGIGLAITGADVAVDVQDQQALGSGQGWAGPRRK